MTDPSPTGTPSPATSDATSLPTVTSLLGDFELLGELGRDDDGRLAYVARAHPSGRLVALDLDQELPPGMLRVTLTPRLRQPPPLESSGMICGRCGTPARDGAAACTECGNQPLEFRVTPPPGATGDALAGASAAEVARQFEVLGVWFDSGPSGAVLFAREDATRRLVTLGVRAVPDGQGVYALAAIPPLGGGVAPAIAADRLTKLCPRCGGSYADELRFCPNDGAALQARKRDDSLVGQVIADRYLVQKKLGQGGMGQVYLAEHVKMHRRCALKVISQSLLHDVDAVSRFHREAENASRIVHSNVAAIYDFGDDHDGRVYLAMEYVDGRPLSALLAEAPVLPIPRAIDIALQVAEALTAAHDLKIVHRDLKPDNIMLGARRDGGDQVKVVDFGVAKMMEVDAQRVTGTGLVVGTPAYMSPEQLTAGALDGRSDLYSLGLVLYRMLTGRLPFAGEGAQEVMFARLSHKPLTLAEGRSDVTFPPVLQEIVNRLLARSAAERYQSADALADHLARVQFELTGTTRRPFAGMMTPPSSAAVSAAGAPPSLPPPPRMAPAVDANPRPPAGPAGATAPSPSRRGVLFAGAAAGAAVVAVVLFFGRERFFGGPSPNGRTEPPAESTRVVAAGDSVRDSVSGAADSTRTASDSARPAQDSAPPSTGGGRDGPVVRRDPDPARAGRGSPSGGSRLTDVEVCVALEQLRNWTDPTTGTDATAQRAIGEVQKLLPSLRSSEDSVAARYYLADAYLLRGDDTRACRQLVAIRHAAAPTRFAAGVNNYLANLNCR